MSFYSEAKLGCAEQCVCQCVQAIDLPLLNEEEARDFLKWDLKDKGLAYEKTIDSVIDDLISHGPGDNKILPISLRIVSAMIKRKIITTKKKYHNEGGQYGLERKFIYLVLNSLKNKKIAPHVIFSLCEPAIGSVVLTKPDMAEIAQIPYGIIESAVMDMKEKT